MAHSDGGYYAIKGFVFQFNKTIFEICDNPGQDIAFERNQDIDFEGAVIQVKFHEETTFSPSQIKAPVLQLFHEFELDHRKTYLYCYFPKQAAGKRQLTQPELKTIFKGLAISKKRMAEFWANFHIVFSSGFSPDLDSTITIIQKTFACDDETAVVYHSVITSHLLKTITENKSKQLRVTSLAEIKALVKGKQTSLFLSAYREFLGKKKYFQLIKSRHFTWLNISDWERIFIIDAAEAGPSEILELSLRLRDKYCKTSANGRIIKSGAPYLYFRGLNKKILRSLKQQLIAQGCQLRDGFAYHGASFSLNSLAEPTTTSNQIGLKFINEVPHLLGLVRRKLGKPTVIYDLHLRNRAKVPIASDKIYCTIQIEKLGDIHQII